MQTQLDASDRRALRKKARAAILEALKELGGESTRHAVLTEAMSRGGFTMKELSATKLVRGRLQRLVDYELSWSLTNLRRDGLVEKPARNRWRLSSRALATQPTSAAERVNESRLTELRAMPYRLYLKTPEWRRTRAAALMRAGNGCSLDADHTKELVVHHRSYERLGIELDSDLTVLCRSCHELFHGLPTSTAGTAARSAQG
jgi:hypothetical protein